MRVALVHEWLVNYAGSERVVEQIINCFPEADVFTLIDNLSSSERGFLHGKKVTTSFLQKIPLAKTKHRLFLPLMPLAIEQFDLSAYDVIISSSHAVAKGVLTGPNQLHICYCHSPMRYAWDMQHQYLKESNSESGVKSWIMRYFLHKIRVWDYRTANGVDYFIANSSFIARRIKKVYARESEVIHPPVDVEKFIPCLVKNDYYFTASRLVPYKKIDLIAAAFKLMPDKKLIIAGSGPDKDKLLNLIDGVKNIRYVGFITDAQMIEYMEKAKAFVFAGEEDFGIIPVEAQACGTPVIAYGVGGVRDSVVAGVTGELFNSQDVSSLIDAVMKFENSSYDANACVDNAKKFSVAEFCSKFKESVLTKYQQFNESV